MWIRFVVSLFAFLVMAAPQAQTVGEKVNAVQLVWMGGNDCPPCVAWRRDELPKLQASAQQLVSVMSLPLFYCYGG